MVALGCYYYCWESVQILKTDPFSSREIDDQFLFGDFFVNIDPIPCASHIMCCAFFMKF